MTAQVRPSRGLWPGDIIVFSPKLMRSGKAFKRTKPVATICGECQMRSVVVGALVLMLFGCSTDHAERRASAASERQRDSTIGASQLPGAEGVRRALRASDSAASRRAQEDSAAREP